MSEAEFKNFSGHAMSADNILLGGQCKSELNDLILSPQASAVCDCQHISFFHHKRKYLLFTYSASSGAHSTTRNTQLARMVRITNDSKNLQSEISNMNL